jgi:hypothetical protein
VSGEREIGAPAGREFERRFFLDGDELVAARWWHVDMRAPASPRPQYDPLPPINEERRAALAFLGGITFLGLSAVLAPHCNGDDDDDTVTITEDALDLQRKQGWNVGSDRALAYEGATCADVAGTTDTGRFLDELPRLLEPTQAELAPFSGGTLFQVLSQPTFRSSLSPIRTDETDRAFARGQALAALFRSPLAAPGTALVVDLPGPLAVAVAAGLADTFEPVFLCDNWPHPLGVVPSHLVIAAALYYRPVFAAERPQRSDHAPPAFILDSNRLLPYRDEPDRFDNRYLARLPSADSFRALRVSRIFYVTDLVVPHELDDLNDDFVALAAANIDIKMVALSEFQVSDWSQPQRYTYGGGGMHDTHVWFWHSYGGGSFTAPAPRAAPAPVGLASGATFHPAPRQTIFSSRVVGGGLGVGKARPSGFGRVTMQTTRVASSASGRSGSFGRARFFSGG